MPTHHGDPGPHPVDVHIGRRLRALRRGRGQSQGDLAAKVEVTYQQVQKYETGANRISASTLYEMARALSEPIAAFYDGLPETFAPPDDGLAAFAARDTLLGSAPGQRLLTALADAPRQLWPALAELLEGLAAQDVSGAGLREPSAPAWDNDIGGRAAPSWLQGPPNRRRLTAVGG